SQRVGRRRYRATSRSVTSHTTRRCGATITTKRDSAATTGRAVERGQHPRTCAPGSKDAATRQLATGPSADSSWFVALRRLRRGSGLPIRSLLLGALPFTVL